MANDIQSQPNKGWLTSYSFLRAGVSAAWIAAAILVGRQSPEVAAGLLVAYPAWDALANLIDAQQSGGLRANFSQSLNLIVSLITAGAVVYALTLGMKDVLLVFAAWAFFAGLFQLVTGVRRWKSGGQWVMILSGGQSALVSFVFVQGALKTPPAGIEAVIPYAALGAIYFLISGIWLTVKASRKRLKTGTV